jgi:hypothetical protein
METSSITVGDTTKKTKVTVQDIDEFFEGAESEYRCRCIVVSDRDSEEELENVINEISRTKGASVISKTHQWGEFGMSVFIEYYMPRS